MKNKFLASLIAPLIVFSVFCYVFFMSYKNDSDASKNRLIDLEGSAIYACKESIKNNLHDPSSAQFPDKSDFKVIRVENSQSYDVIVSVRAKNAFNALRLSRFKCEIREISVDKNGAINWKSNVFVY